MDDLLFPNEFKTLQQGISEATNQSNAKSLEVVLLYQLVKIHAEKRMNDICTELI